MLYWIPDQIWNVIAEEIKADKKTYFYLVDLLLLGWSFLIIAIVSYPIGLCNAAMVAVHNLSVIGEKPTLSKCWVHLFFYSCWDNDYINKTFLSSKCF